LTDILQQEKLTRFLVMTQFENREFWFARKIPLLAEEGWLRDQSRSREATFFRADGVVSSAQYLVSPV